MLLSMLPLDPMLLLERIDFFDLEMLSLVPFSRFSSG